MNSPTKNPDKRLILGIDPGFSGGITFYDYIDHKVVDTHQIPTTEDPVSKKTVINITALSFLIDYRAKDILLCAIERVGVMSGKEGVVSMFRFGEGFGIVKGVVGSFYIPIYPIAPAVWKSSFNLLHSDKNKSIGRASEIFPEDSGRWRRKKDNGIAESALIAAFAGKMITQKVLEY